MTKRIKVADLKNKVTQVVREIETRGSTFLITKHSVPVAVIKPISNEERQGLYQSRNITSFLLRVEGIAKKVAGRWPKGLSAAEAVSKERR